jgi:hypothetical protein
MNARLQSQRTQIDDTSLTEHGSCSLPRHTIQKSVVVRFHVRTK